MKISSGGIEVEIYPDELRHFKLETVEDLRLFMDKLHRPEPKPAGFKTEKHKEETK